MERVVIVVVVVVVALSLLVALDATKVVVELEEESIEPTTAVDWNSCDDPFVVERWLSAVSRNEGFHGAPDDEGLPSLRRQGEAEEEE